MTHQTFNQHDFVSRLRAARKAQNLAQKDASARFAELSGKSIYVYLSYERGERTPPQKAIPILARMLKLDSQFLLYGTQKASKINQLTQEIGENASHNASVRHISIITAQEIEQYLLSQDGAPAMTSNSMPIPREFGSVLGAKTFIYQIPAGDQSMTGT